MTGTGAASILPALEPHEARHSAAVLQAVRQAIAMQGGWLAFDEYLRIVLYAPGLGYYSAGSIKLGREGDFITAPELPEGLFGRALARQCAEVLRVVGGDVLELGAGTGALAATLLPALQQLGVLPQHYDILEVSGDLIARQRQRLATLPKDLRARIRWRETLPGAPVAGVFLANEVADALPFRRFAVDHSGSLERGVALSAQGELILANQDADAALTGELTRITATLPGGLAAWRPGYQSEFCPMLGPWVGALGAALARGAMFIIDYGLPRHEYYHPERMRGTLRCHFRHRAHEDALLYPGLQDITAWVDFTRIAEAAADTGLEVAGYCTQAAFLLANGIESDVAAGSTTLERARLAGEARQLLLPAEMGEYFKVMALARGLDEVPLRGFACQDLRHRL